MIFEYISLASGLNFIVLAIVLLLKKAPNLKSNKILFFLFLFMAVYSGFVTFHYTALQHKDYSSLIYYTPVDGIFLLLMGPCLYFYILSVLNKHIYFKNWKMLVHIIPFIPYILFNIYFLTLPIKERTDWLILDFNAGTYEMNLLNGIIYSQIIIYLLVSYRLVTNQLKTTSIIEFEKTQFDISWLKVYLIINLCFMIISLPLCFIISNEKASIIIGQLSMDIQFVYMFFKWTLHTESSSIKSCNESTDKSNMLKLNSDVADNHLSKLQVYMEDFKPYLDEECSIQTVSEQTGIPAHQLSNILNCKLQKTFPEFINEYRVKAAKTFLLSIKQESTTIESIAIDCGFGSKTHFNRTFKKYTNNLTPSEFIRQHKLKE
jgi:AraC-like DNA-binding protein